MAFNGSLDHLVPQMGRVLTNDKSKLNQLKFGYNSTYVRPAVNREPRVVDNSKFNFSTFTNSILIQGVDKADHSTNMMYTFDSLGDLTDENNAFLNKLKSLDSDETLYAVLIGDNVDITKIPNGLFQNNTGLRYVYIGKNVTEIGDNAFKDCVKLSTITGFDNVATIGTNAFDNTSIKTIVINKGPGQVSGFETKWGANEDTIISWTGSLVTNAAKVSLFNTKTLELTAYDTIADVNDALTEASEDDRYELIFGDDWCAANTSAFVDDPGIGTTSDPSNRTKISKVTIGEGITAIGSTTSGGQMGGFTNANELVLPSTLETISDGAFGYWSKLKYLTIKPTSSLTTIGAGSFNTSMIEDIVIPDSVTTIGQGAFAGSHGIHSITFGSGLTTISQGAFNGDSAADQIFDDTITTLNIPAATTKIGSGAFAYRYTIKTVNIGDENHASQLQLSDIGGSEYYSYCAFAFIDPRVSTTGAPENITINIYGKTAEDYTKEALFQTINSGMSTPPDIDAFFTEHNIQINFIPVS